MLKRIIPFFFFALLLYLIPRIYIVLDLPIFNDEAIYVRWAQLAKYHRSLRYISLTDGKQPLFIWLSMLLIPVFRNPLLAGRLVSLAAGFLTMTGLFLLTRKLFNNIKVAFAAVLLYALFPLAVLLDSLALYDGLVAAFSIWSLYLAVLVVKSARLDLALILAHILGASLLNKTSGFINLYLLPVPLALFSNWRRNFRHLFRIVFLLLLSVFLANIYYSLLRMAPHFEQISKKTNLFVYPPHDLNPDLIGKTLVRNLPTLSSWLFSYLGIPVLLLALSSFVFIKSYFREKLVLILWFALPFVGLIIRGRIIYPRYLLFMTVSLLPLAALAGTKLLNFFFKQFSLRGIAAVLLLILGPYMYTDTKIMTDIPHAPIPKADREQYANSWTAGTGIREIAAYLEKESFHSRQLVLTEGLYGSLATTGMELYLSNNPAVEIQPLERIPLLFPLEYLQASQEIPVYLLLNQAQDPPFWPLELVQEYQKGTSNSYLRLYRVNPWLWF